MINIESKTAIVTGGTRGIGRAIVDLLIEHGCRVIYTGTDDKQPDNEKKAIYKQLDLSSFISLKHFIDNVIQQLPCLDILINNAGINIIESIESIKHEHWQRILNVNLTGPMMVMQESVKLMKNSQKGGKILNISSIFGVVSKAKRGAYSAAKAGLIGLTRASALDLAPYDILVNAICPGFTMTELTTSILSTSEIHRLSSEIPLGRFADVTEIAEAAVFLCSNMNTYMTGQTLVIDGGFTAK